jgi:hypothetical protein
VLLEEPSCEDAGAFDPGAYALHHDIRAMGQGCFVMIVDDRLRSRRTFAYSGLADVPSPLEFLGWADAIRARHSSAEDELSPARAHPAHIATIRHHKHRPAGLPCNRTAHAG